LLSLSFCCSILSIVCLGLDLLAEDFQQDDNSDDLIAQGRSESVQLIKESASTAVNILNDLLQYDRLQDDALVVSKAMLPALDFIYESIEPFKIQVLILCTVYCVLCTVCMFVCVHVCMCVCAASVRFLLFPLNKSS
jgi:hypothetical protein